MNSAHIWRLAPAHGIPYAPELPLEVTHKTPDHGLWISHKDLAVMRFSSPKLRAQTTDELRKAMRSDEIITTAHVSKAISRMQKQPNKKSSERVWCSWSSVERRFAQLRSFELIRTVIASALKYGCEFEDLAVMCDGRLATKPDCESITGGSFLRNVALVTLNGVTAGSMTERERHYSIDFAIKLYNGCFNAETLWEHPFLASIKEADFPLSVPTSRDSSVLCYLSSVPGLQFDVQQKNMVHYALTQLWDLYPKNYATMNGNLPWAHCEFEAPKGAVNSVRGMPNGLDLVAYPDRVAPKHRVYYPEWHISLKCFRACDPQWSDTMTATVMRTILEVQKQVLVRNQKEDPEAKNYISCKLARMLIMGDGTVRYGARVTGNGIVCKTPFSWKHLCEELTETFKSITEGCLELGQDAEDFATKLENGEFKSVDDALGHDFVANVCQDTDARKRPCFRLVRPEHLPPKGDTNPPLLKDVLAARILVVTNVASHSLRYALQECKEGRSMPRFEVVTVTPEPTYGRRGQHLFYNGFVPYVDACRFYKKAAKLAGEVEDKHLLQLIEGREASLDDLTDYLDAKTYLTPSLTEPNESTESLSCDPTYGHLFYAGGKDGVALAQYLKWSESLDALTLRRLLEHIGRAGIAVQRLTGRNRLAVGSRLVYWVNGEFQSAGLNPPAVWCRCSRSRVMLQESCWTCTQQLLARLMFQASRGDMKGLAASLHSDLEAGKVATWESFLNHDLFQISEDECVLTWMSTDKASYPTNDLGQTRIPIVSDLAGRFYF